MGLFFLGFGFFLLGMAVVGGLEWFLQRRAEARKLCVCAHMRDVHTKGRGKCLGTRCACAWFYPLAFAALALVGCSAPVESTSIDQAAAGPALDGACARSEPQHTPTVASCYRVESQGTPLDTCEGATASNEEQTTRGPGYIVTAFELEPGACFYFYACGGDTFAAAAPTVEVCP